MPSQAHRAGLLFCGGNMNIGKDVIIAGFGKLIDIYKQKSKIGNYFFILVFNNIIFTSEIMTEKKFNEIFEDMKKTYEITE